MATIKISDFIEALELEVLSDGAQQEFEITTSDLNRPGIHMAGFFDYFASDRIQVMGRGEMMYIMSTMSSEQRYSILDRFFSYRIPCIVISRGMEAPPELMQAAEKYNCPVFRSQQLTTKVMHQIISYIDDLLVPRMTRHGVLLDITGVGMLLTGESGIGKSETAMELVKRGHRLVADDVVEIVRTGKNELMGSAPEMLRHFMEIRGVGIIDLRQLYGIDSVLDQKIIDIVIHIEGWDNTRQYDRLGLTDEWTTILGVKLPKITIPVRPGRNLAIIMEVAALNHRLKNKGYNAAQILTDRFTGGGE